MRRITISIDLGKLDKSRIQKRTYEKNGQQITVNELKLDVIEVAEPKVLKEGDTWRLVKSCFVAETPTKEEREGRVKTAIVGDGVEFQDLSSPQMDGGGELPF